jgi:hypothetical protein
MRICQRSATRDKRGRLHGLPTKRVIDYFVPRAGFFAASRAETQVCLHFNQAAQRKILGIVSVGGWPTPWRRRYTQSTAV